MKKITKDKAYFHETEALKGWYYQLPDIEDGRSVIYAEVTGDHGQRIIGDHPRIYFVIEGEGEFVVNGEKTTGVAGDTIVIPPNSTYSYKATRPVLKVILFMDLIDLSKLPQAIK